MAANIGQQMQALYTRFGHLSGITVELHKELLALRVQNQQATATVFIQGAQITEYTPRGKQPVLWCSEHSDYIQGQSIRGGIPICWPWFGDLERNPSDVRQHVPMNGASHPKHGLARTKDWHLDSVDIIDKGTTRITLSLTLLPNDEPLWPYACELTVVLTIGAELSLEFTVRNTGDKAMAYTSALHSYFSVDNIRDTSISGVDNAFFIDCLNDWHQDQQEGELSITQETDRIYHSMTEPLAISDANRRMIRLATQGSHSAVVWNPWIEKSKRLSGFGDDDYERMLCIETANVLDDFVALGPNEQHSVVLSVDIK